MRYALLFLLLAVSAGCELPTANTTEEKTSITPADATGEHITLANEADRPLVGIAFGREEMQLVDPIPAFRAPEFQKRRLEIGATENLHLSPGYEPGDSLVILIYAESEKPDPQVTERYGPGAAVWIKSLTLTANELREQANRVVVSEL